MLSSKKCSDALSKIREIIRSGRVTLILSVHLASIIKLYTKIALSTNLLRNKSSLEYKVDENKFILLAENKSILLAENKFILLKEKKYNL